MEIRVTIPEWTHRKTGITHEAFCEVCELVDVIIMNGKPKSEDVLKYYGVQAPKSVYEAIGVDRMILQREDGTYIVMPNTPKTGKLWELVI